MRSWSIFQSLLLCAIFNSYAQAEEPAAQSGLTNANIGDWVEYSVHTANVGTIERRTVTAKDAKSITIKTTVHALYRTDAIYQIVIPLDKSYNPGVNDPDAKVEKVAVGDEKISVLGRDCDTHWIKYKGTGKAGATIEGKVWISNDIALGGMVKMESPGSHLSMILTKTSADK
jgi:hypothetical protein